MGTALLAGGAGLVGGALLMDAFEDHEQDAFEEGELFCLLVEARCSLGIYQSVGREDQFQQDQYNDGGDYGGDGGDFGGDC